MILRAIGAILGVSLSVGYADAQTFTTVQWGANRGDSPWQIGIYDQDNIAQPVFTLPATGGGPKLLPSACPVPSNSTLGCIESISPVLHEWVEYIDSSGAQHLLQPAASDLSNGTTGSGAVVLATSPALTTPNLGTPSAVTLTNATGLPISSGVSGLGTGVATALAVNVGTAGSPVVNGGALGTPSSGTATNLTGLPIAGLSGLGTGVGSALGNALNGAGGLVGFNSLASGVATALGIAPNAAGGFVSVPNTDSCVYQNSASAVAGCETTLPSGLTIPGYGALATAQTWTGLQTFGTSNTWPQSLYSIGLYGAIDVTDTRGVAALVESSRTSDNTGAVSPQQITNTCLNVSDNTGTSVKSWCNYWQTWVTATAENPQTFGAEGSFYNLGSVASADPYTDNPTANTEEMRLDAGIGSGSPNNVTTAIHILNNGAAFENGIICSATGLDTGSSRIAPCLGMGQNEGIEWFSAANTMLAQIYGITSGGFPVLIINFPNNGSINFRQAGANFMGLDATDLFPNVNNSMNLGSPSLAWKTFYTVQATIGTSGIINSGLYEGPQNTWADNQTCIAGQITWDAGFIYVCTATNTVKRAALSTF